MKGRRFFIILPVLLCVTALAIANSVTSKAASVTFDTRRVSRALVHVITADLNDPRIRVEVGLAEKGIPHSESFLRMVRRHRPAAAVTGTYFDTRTLFPVGSIIIGGRTAHESAIGTAVCFLRQNGVVCTSGGSGQAAKAGAYTVRFALTAKGERFSWQGVETGLRTGPLLLSNGAYCLNPAREGFRHPGLFGARTRIALGLTAHNKLLLVAVNTPITFGKLAGVMKALGAMDAVALDGGTSSAMYYRGRIVNAPGRALTNIIEVYEMLPQVAAKKDAIAPDTIYRATPANSQVLAQYTRRPAPNMLLERRSPISLSLPFTSLSESAMIPSPLELAGAKGRHASFPIHRTKLSRLKSFDHSKNFVHIATDVKIMHHLIA